MTPGMNDIRAVLSDNGPMTRPQLSQHFGCSLSEVAKPIYSLRARGDVLEDGDLVTLLKTAPQRVTEPDSMVGSTPTEKTAPVPVSAPAIGMQEAEPSPSDDDAIRAALLLILNELPGLMRDRETLRKLREVLG
jgi:hypothetical protein